ncbi:MAG TPA: VTT domain-containing protein [Gammaproteobacteria bacterium]|nr:VTT domain-containing protein [Gammaproteobacteria bacterium]
MKRINPIYLLIALNILLIVFRELVVSEEASAAFGSAIESSVLGLGVFGYVGIVMAYGLCAFFFVPLLIPLNILGGALYGAYVGTGVALAGIVLGCVASTVSARYVFTGMQRSLDEHPRLKRLIVHADRHRNLVIVIMRFTVVVPYLVQNIALATTSSSIVRITLITAVSAVPGAAIYSFLGAGLVHADQVNELLFYLALPIVLLVVVFGALAYMRKKYEEP